MSSASQHFTDYKAPQNKALTIYTTFEKTCKIHTLGELN